MGSKLGKEEMKEMRQFMDSEKMVGLVGWRFTSSKLQSEDTGVRKLGKK